MVSGAVGLACSLIINSLNSALAIQQNRDPIGYTKRTRRYSPVKSTSIGSFQGKIEAASSPDAEVELQDSVSGSGSHRGVSKFDPNLSPQHSVIEVSAEQLAEDVLMRSLMAVERRIGPIRWESVGECREQTLIALPLQELADKGRQVPH